MFNCAGDNMHFIFCTFFFRARSITSFAATPSRYNAPGFPNSFAIKCFITVNTRESRGVAAAWSRYILRKLVMVHILALLYFFAKQRRVRYNPFLYGGKYNDHYVRAHGGYYSSRPVGHE